MAPAYAAARMRQYSDTASAVIALEASPHRLIAMLYDGALERLASARIAIERGDVAGKLRGVNGVMAIIEHLRVVLDHRAGGTLAARLDALYDYLLRRIAQANAANDPQPLAEVSSLLITVKSAWDDIAQEVG